MPLKKVVLDACVLFPWALRDIFLRATDADLYKLCLTDQILILQFSEDKEAMITIIRDHINDLRKPPLTTEEALIKLENLIPHFIQLIRNEL